MTSATRDIYLRGSSRMNGKPKPDHAQADLARSPIARQATAPASNLVTTRRDERGA